MPIRGESSCSIPCLQGQLEGLRRAIEEDNDCDEVLHTLAAFIIAIRGTVWQAVLLGLSAAISHSLHIWVLAAGVLHYGSKWNAENIEPYLQIGSVVAILGLALWMFLRTRQHEQAMIWPRT